MTLGANFDKGWGRGHSIPSAPPLPGTTVSLEPLRVDHAELMAPLLHDRRLHAFTGGKPETVVELRTRYERQVVGSSPDGSERWRNWIVRRTDDGRAAGAVQATVSVDDVGLVAEVAWIIAWAHQGQGLASDAADVMVGWLRRHDVRQIVAHIPPGHDRSAGVARKIGLSPTPVVEGGEVRWEG